VGRTILVIGGLGFVGSHLVDALVARGDDVRIMDNLEPQVHGTSRNAVLGAGSTAVLWQGDVRSRRDRLAAMDGAGVVFHLAASVGVGQSMYQVHKYVEVNTMGTAMLLDILVNEKHKVETLVVASSMSVYGEGAYTCKECGLISPSVRSPEQLQQSEWEIRCPHCKGQLGPQPTTEKKPLMPTSIYAFTKRHQEEMCLAIGQAYGIRVVSLRYFNIYGPRQALSNPYTGVAAIFSSRLLNGRPPVIFEDGLQSRDFIHVSDVVQATLLAMDSERANGEVLNVGMGRRTTVLEMARILSTELCGLKMGDYQ